VCVASSFHLQNSDAQASAFAQAVAQGTSVAKAVSQAFAQAFQTVSGQAVRVPSAISNVIMC
jgi:glyceraldehyde-3-phosphate dehydrogenase/erythrose-4-phosphate dehydrogenase